MLALPPLALGTLGTANFTLSSPQLSLESPEASSASGRLRSDSGTNVCLGVGAASTGGGATCDFSSPCSYFSCQYISESCFS